MSPSNISKEKNCQYYLTWKNKHPEKAKAAYKQKRQRQKERMKIDPLYKQKILEQEKNIRIRAANKHKNELIKILNEHSLKCDLCGFSDVRALEVHHINGTVNGNGHKKQWYKEMLWLRTHRGEVQVLCANCHTIIHNPRKYLPEQNPIKEVRVNG